MYVTMNRCGHLYTTMQYSKHCLRWLQISCHSQSQSYSHVTQQISLHGTSVQ